MPWFTFFAVIGLKSIMEWQPEWIKNLIGIIPAFFGFLYSIIVIVLPIHLIGAVLLSIGSFLGMILEPKNTRSMRIKPFFVILCFTIVIFSRISVDGLIYYSSFPFNYASKDEIIIAEYLNKYNSKQEIVVAYNNLVAKRIQALSFQPVLRPANHPASVYYGWISVKEIQIKTVFDFLEILRTGIPFKTNITFPESSLFYSVSYLDLRDLKSFEKIHNTGIRYVVTYNPSSADFTQNMPLFSSIMEVGILRIETCYLRLYEISGIYG